MGGDSCFTLLMRNYHNTQSGTQEQHTSDLNPFHFLMYEGKPLHSCWCTYCMRCATRHCSTTAVILKSENVTFDKLQCLICVSSTEIAVQDAFSSVKVKVKQEITLRFCGPIPWSPTFLDWMNVYLYMSTSSTKEWSLFPCLVWIVFERSI